MLSADVSVSLVDDDESCAGARTGGHKRRDNNPMQRADIVARHAPQRVTHYRDGARATLRDRALAEQQHYMEKLQ